MSESLKQLADKLLTLAGQMTAAEMAAVKGCILRHDRCRR